MDVVYVCTPTLACGSFVSRVLPVGEIPNTHSEPLLKQQRSLIVGRGALIVSHVVVKVMELTLHEIALESWTLGACCCVPLDLSTGLTNPGEVIAESYYGALSAVRSTTPDAWATQGILPRYSVGRR